MRLPRLPDRGTPPARRSSATQSPAQPVGRTAASLGRRSRSHATGARRLPTHRRNHRHASRNDPTRPRRTRKPTPRPSRRPHPASRRRSAASRKKDPTLVADLLKCVAPETAGNPCSDEKWCRSRLRALSQKLDGRACPTTIGRLLREQKFGLRSHRKTLHTGKPHAERDRQFRHIQEQREDFRRSGDPRIRRRRQVKKDTIGQFAKSGRGRGVSRRRRSTTTTSPRTPMGERLPTACMIRNATKDTSA